MIFQLNPDREGPMRQAIRRELQTSPGYFSVLEIGSWSGESAILWAQEIRDAGQGGVVVCVDPWAPYFKPEDMVNRIVKEMDRMARDGSILEVFTRNIETAGVSAYIVPIRSKSVNALPILQKGFFDFVYIDGSHAHKDVSVDIALSKRLVQSGGLLCGDDLEMQRDDISVEEFSRCMESRDLDITYVSTGYLHPGVMIAVDDEFGRVHCENGFWSVRRDGDKWVSE